MEWGNAPKIPGIYVQRMSDDGDRWLSIRKCPDVEDATARALAVQADVQSVRVVEIRDGHEVRVSYPERMVTQ